MRFSFFVAISGLAALVNSLPVEDMHAGASSEDTPKHTEDLTICTLYVSLTFCGDKYYMFIIIAADYVGLVQVYGQRDSTAGRVVNLVPGGGGKKSLQDTSNTGLGFVFSLWDDLNYLWKGLGACRCKSIT